MIDAVRRTARRLVRRDTLTHSSAKTAARKSGKASGATSRRISHSSQSNPASFRPAACADTPKGDAPREES